MSDRQSEISRRSVLGSGALALGGVLSGGSAAQAQRTARNRKSPFRYCLNTATIMGQKVPVDQEVDIAAKAGYHAIEPWIRELEAFEKSGGSLADLGKKIKDRGLTVESAIGFFEWIVDDEAKRKAALENARRSMELVAKIGGTRLAAPPVGATDRNDISLVAAAERYRALVEIGEQMGVIPQVEVWGFSKTLHRLGDASLIAIESGHAKACVLADVYHLYKGGSGFAGLGLLSGAAMQVFHVNDYPGDQSREKITDAHRVYPGDGVAPLGEVFRSLRAAGFTGTLSLELFNRDYWMQDPQVVATTGLQKMKAAVEKALAG